MKLSYAVSPMHVNQPFGANPAYYARFKDSYGQPEKGHMGVDFMAAHGTPLYAPCDGEATFIVDDHGGEGFHITTFDGTNHYMVILWHLCSRNDPKYKPLIATDGSSVQVKRGQHIGYTDNTGAPFESSGDHLHFGLAPLHDDGIRFLHPTNGYGGCIDPIPFFDGTYAQDGEVPPPPIVAEASAIIAETAQLPIAQRKALFPSLQALVDSIVAAWRGGKL